MNKPLFTILVTVALDIIWLWFVLPFLPFVVEGFWKWEEFVWIAFGVFSLWMLLGWIVLWKLSDTYWRKNILKISVGLNLLWYLLFAFSPNIWVFILWRFFSGLWGSGWAIGSAYISDISNDENRTKNLWLIWATFGIWFVIGPLFWALINTSDVLLLWIIPAFVIFLNLLMIFFFLPETNKHLEEKVDTKAWLFDFHQNKKQIYILLFMTLVIWACMAALQATFALLLNDRFGFTQNIIWYLFVYIWICSITYQALWIKHVRKVFDEKAMILLWLVLLIVSFFLFWFNYLAYLTLLVIPLNVFWMWSIQPAVSSLLAKIAWNEVWKAMWANASFMSFGNIVWAIWAWYLYTFWSWIPYFVSWILFIGVLFVGWFFVG